MKKTALVLLFVSAAGCSSITHELQPHRLWRWNYQETPNRTDDALFSIDDPKIPAMSGSDHKVQGSAKAVKRAVPTNHE